MSIQVNNNDLALTTGAAPAEHLKPTVSGGSSSSTFGKTAEDHITVSSAAENISSALATQHLQQSQRIQQLGSLIAAGKYNVASQDLSRAIVSSAIGGTAGAPGGSK
jgi:anti-sigma28 factor (negative regulator of flagellin synthesis)